MNSPSSSAEANALHLWEQGDREVYSAVSPVEWDLYSSRFKVLESQGNQFSVTRKLKAAFSL